MIARAPADTCPRIGLVHALFASIAPIEAAFAELWPEARPVSLYDQSLYLDFEAQGEVTEAIARRIERLLELSAESGARAILFTGSLFGAAVERARNKFEVPVLTAYEAMIEEALASAPRPRLAALATAPGTLAALAADLTRAAEARGIACALETHHVPGALEALLEGRRDAHDERVLAAAAGLAPAEAILLGQFSMAPLAGRIARLSSQRVLSSPACAVAKLRRLVAG